VKPTQDSAPHGPRDTALIYGPDVSIVKIIYLQLVTYLKTYTHRNQKKILSLSC